MGTNGTEISREIKFSKKAESIEFPQSEPFNRKYRKENQIQDKVPGKKFSKIWIHLARLLVLCS